MAAGPGISFDEMFCKRLKFCTLPIASMGLVYIPVPWIDGLDPEGFVSRPCPLFSNYLWF